MPYHSPHFHKLDTAPHSAIVKRSVVIRGRKTSVSLEDIFWAGLRHVALDQNTTISELIARIDTDRNGLTRSSAIRQFIMFDMQDRARGRISHDADEIEEDQVEALAMTPKLAPVD